jgi:hypothetical protein
VMHHLTTIDIRGHMRQEVQSGLSLQQSDNTDE